MHCEGKLKFRSYNTSCVCLIEVVTKAGLTGVTVNKLKKL